ncbi:MAG: polysaccharide deacetylase family protein [Candidatus Angelobacter sp.]
MIHADDLGMCPSVNRAITMALESGAVNSASLMVPCPYFQEAAEWIRQHPEYDVGIHSTLISEWETYRWGPVAKTEYGKGLADDNGYFWPRNSLLRAEPERIYEEISAQIMLAKQVGVNPTHLDSHMLSVARPGYITAYIKAARQFGLPFLIDEYWHSRASDEGSATAQDVVADDLLQAHFKLSVDDLEEYYLSILRGMKPGLNVLLVHPGFDDNELRAITGGCLPYGAAWRQRDFEMVTSAAFRSALGENKIQLVNWRTIKSALGKRTGLLPDENRRAV